MNAVALDPTRRASLARYGKILEVMTIVWAGTEASIALWSAAQSGSTALAGFGWDSVIEVISAVAIWWRMSHEMNHERRHQAEAVSLKLAGSCLYALGTYILFDALFHLWKHEHATVGKLGIAITTAAMILMPWLAREKRRIGSALHSSAMMTDAKQTDFCMYQAAIVLGGLLLQLAFKITWADSVAALILVPILFRAGFLTFKGEHCCALH